MRAKMSSCGRDREGNEGEETDQGSLSIMSPKPGVSTIVRAIRTVGPEEGVSSRKNRREDGSKAAYLRLPRALFTRRDQDDQLGAFDY
jgi:hypothetical protein